jgi:hypothetical protein
VNIFEQQCQWLQRIHVPDDDKLCVWCTRHYRQPVLHPCPRRHLADSILSQEVRS